MFQRNRLNRRTSLLRCGAGFGAVALSALLADKAYAAGTTDDASAATEYPLAPKQPHFPARAKRVIFLFMPGGPSQVDTFDPKPRLEKDNPDVWWNPNRDIP